MLQVLGVIKSLVSTLVDLVPRLLKKLSEGTWHGPHLSVSWVAGIWIPWMWSVHPIYARFEQCRIDRLISILLSHSVMIRLSNLAGFLQLGTPQKHSNLDALDLFTFCYYRNPWFGCRNLYTHFSISKAVHNLVYFLATGKFIAGPWSRCFSFSLWKKLSALLFRQPASKTHRLSQICHRSIPSRNFAPCKNTHFHPCSIITSAKMKVFSSQPNPTHQRLGMFMFTTAPSLLRAVNFLRQQSKGRDTPRTWMAYGYQTMHACIMRMEWDTGILSWLLMGSTIYIIWYNMYIYIIIQYISYTFIYIHIHHFNPQPLKNSRLIWICLKHSQTAQVKRNRSKFQY